MPEDLSWTRPYGKDAVTVASDEEAGPCLCWPPRPWGGTGVGRHSAIRRNPLVIALVIGIPLALLGASIAAAAIWGRQPEQAANSVTTAAKCETPVKVVAAKSFAPVLSALAPELSDGKDCARLEVEIADGREAARHIEHFDADVWIPDDTAWATVAGDEYAEPDVTEHATVLATSPIYFVTKKATAPALTGAGTSWLGLADLVESRKGIRPVLRDPAGTGDGLIAAGALGEAVWLKSGMDVSAEYLAAAVAASRTVPGTGAAKPSATAEVALVPEYALLQQGWADDQVVLAPSDHTAELRYTWLPEDESGRSQKVTRAMDRVLRTLQSEDTAPEFTQAGLRGPDGAAPRSNETKRLPEVTAKPFDVLAPHHIDHVFATWYPSDRRSDILLVVDISGSMGAPAPGTKQPLIRSVARGCDRLGALLPDDSRLTLWEFGSKIDGNRDYRTVLARAALSATHRKELATATRGLQTGPSGTGLYDTLLAAYQSARDNYRAGRPNQVVLFTDGLNQDDTGSITAPQLQAALKKANDPKRPVALSVITFGQDKQAATLEKVLSPVEGSVKDIANASEVDALFIHVAAGGLEH